MGRRFLIGAILLGVAVVAELRRPLGIAIVGGLILSQTLTLFTTPVVYLYMDRANNRLNRWRARLSERLHRRPSRSAP